MSDRASSANDRPVDELYLEQIVEDFESAWSRDGDARVRDFLPAPTHAEYDDVLRELLCVDFERRYKSGQPTTVESYRQEYPDLEDRKSVLEAVAFEEYRLLSARGTAVSPEDYGRKYGIQTLHWPRQTPRGDNADTVASSALADGIAGEMERIVGVTQSLPKVGERFLNFEIVEQLGECKFGSVCLANQGDLANRQVVIKLTTNLWSESDRLARLQHTNIVPIYSVHQHGGLQAVCMPFLGRHTLASLIEKRKGQSRVTGSVMLDLLQGSDQSSAGGRTNGVPGNHFDHLRSLTYEQLCTWMLANISAGLAHAHERGILHRDLKPANILLTDDAQPMILDFNLSEDAIAGGRASLLIGGTLPYMAPEHLRAVVADGRVDERSDIYSLGVMLFQLLTGRLPFPIQPGSIIGNLSYLINDRCNVTPSVCDLDPQFSTDIESIAQRCLAARPDDRYQTALELHEDLDRHLQNLPLKYAANRSRKDRVAKWIKRHPRLSSSTVVGATCALVLAILVGAFALRGREIAVHEAIDRFEQFQVLGRQASAPLSVAITDDDLVRIGLRDANAALALYSAEGVTWEQHADVRRLDPARRQELLESMQSLQYLVADTIRFQALHMESPDMRRRSLEVALRHNQLGQAIADSRNAGLSALLLQRARLEDDLGRRDTAASIRKRANGLADRDIASRLLSATGHIRGRRFTSAADILKPLSRELPQDRLVWFLLGNCEFSLNHFGEADTCFTSAATLWPDFYIPHFYRGLCRMKAKRFSEAEEDFSEVLRRKPTLTSAWANRAMVRFEQEKYQDSADDLTQAIELGRDTSLVYLLRARAWKGLGLRAEADKDLKTGVDQTPTCFEGWIYRSAALRSSDPIAALSDLDMALKSRPKSHQALQNRAALLSQMGRNEEAIVALTKLVDAFPADATALLGRGLLRARLGQRDAAIRDGELGLKYSGSPSHQFQMARLLAQTAKQSPGDSDRAIGHLAKALAGQPKLITVVRRDQDLAPITDNLDVRMILLSADALRDAANLQPK